MQTQLRVAFFNPNTKTRTCPRILAHPSHLPMARVHLNWIILAKGLVRFSITVYNVVY